MRNKYNEVAMKRNMEVMEAIKAVQAIFNGEKNNTNYEI